MSAYLLTSLDVRKVGEKEWMFLSPMVINVVVDGVSCLVRVPDGFVTDFASVPRIPLVFWMFGGIGEYAAGAHDWLYTTAEYPRDVCDAIFREILIHVDGAGKFRANAMHRGVRIGGAARYGSRACTLTAGN